MGVTELVFELYALKATIKGVFNRSYRCYGNLGIFLISKLFYQLKKSSSIDSTQLRCWKIQETVFEPP